MSEPREPVTDPEGPPLVAPPKGRFVRDTFVYLAATAVNAALPVVLLPILTRVLSPADYGVVAMFTVAVSLITAFTGLSMHGAISVRYFKLDPAALARFVTACLVTLGATTAAALILFVVAGPLLERLIGVPREWLLIAVVVSALQMLCLIKLTLWQVRREPVRFAAFQIGQTVLNLTASLVLVLLIGMKWEGRLLGQVVALTLFGALAFALLVRRGDLSRARHLGGDLRAILRFGIPVIPHAIGSLMIAAIDRVIIAAMIDLSAAGIYLVGLQVAMALGLVTEAFNKVYSPWLMGHLGREGAAGQRRIVRGTYAYFVAVIAFAGLLGLLAPTIIGLLAGDAFQQSSSVVFFLALGCAFGGCYLMVTNYIFYAGKTEWLAAVTLSCGAINVALTYWLVRTDGIAGAALAFAITQLLFFLATWALANRVYPMPWLRALAPR